MYVLTSYQEFIVIAFLFFTGAILGWVIELFYRRLVERRQNPKGEWQNPGFLTGPWLPVYGFGATALFALSLIETYIARIDTGGVLHYILMIVFMSLIMTLIEFAGGIIFIKGMHLKLWDYSKEWGNIQGIICPKYSFFWALLSAVYYFFLFPYFMNLVIWFIDHPWFSFVVGTVFGFFVIDCAFSVHLGTVLRKRAMQIDRKAALDLQKMQSILMRDRQAKFFSTHSAHTLTAQFDRFEEFISNSPAKKKRDT